MTDGPTLPSVPCTQTLMCISLCHLCPRARLSAWCYLTLDLSVKIQYRHWQMSQTRWRLVHWKRSRRYTKISLRHHAGLWQWYPAARRCRVVVHTDMWCPVRRISSALNLGLERNFLGCGNPVEMTKKAWVGDPAHFKILLMAPYVTPASEQYQPVEAFHDRT